MTKTITAQDLRHLWVTGAEIALIDLREEGPYAEAHPLFALTIPVSEVEAKVPGLVPRLGAPIVVYDNGEGYAEPAAARITALGYTDVAVLAGGLSAYARVGEVYIDVNVPSKAFGELVESIRDTPSLPAPEVKRILDAGGDHVVLDARRYEEFNTMSIPGGQSVPGGELVYRIHDIAPSPDTLVIVNCAGRTRSIIGTQSLVNAGVPNRVVALRNGTIGWVLEGLPLAKGAVGQGTKPTHEGLARARSNAAAWADHVGVPVISGETLARFRTEAEDRTLYTLDVRDPTEYAAGHPAGFASAPGGQLVQATDEWLGVRGARVVLYDDDGVRARMAASWLLQMGWDVHVLEQGADLGDFRPPKAAQAALPQGPFVTPAELADLPDATVIDLARAATYGRGHVPGAWFASGPELARDLRNAAGDGPIVLTSPDGAVAAANLAVAQRATTRPVLLLQGGTDAWRAAGLPVEMESRHLSPPIDAYKRPYEGTDNAREKMEGYIAWELKLVAQLANDGVARFHVVRAK
jgi:rhodanese-related sulfurtransferase